MFETEVERASAPLPFGVDVIVRIHDVTRLMELDRALFSLVNQSLSPVRPIIVTQNFTDADHATLVAAIRKYDWVKYQVEPRVINVIGEPNKDIRSNLLNAGIKEAKYRFLAILDFDDYMYEHAYQYLVDSALEKNDAIAFGGIASKYICVFSSYIYNVGNDLNKFKGNGLEDLVADNFCPIHSFVVDRSIVDNSDLFFDESYTRLEDYNFLLRICTKYKANFKSREKYVGVYNFNLSGSNTNPAIITESAKRKSKELEWMGARRKIFRLKLELGVRYGETKREDEMS